MPGSASRAVVRVERGLRHEDDDRLAEEVPVAMHFDGAPFAVMMASPADLEDFARGFALTEGKVASMIEIADIDVREVLEGVVVDVHTWQGRSGEPRPSLATDDAGARTRGELPGRSGCGICGSRELEDVVR
ncbi:MAG: formate dehydrogenase accessory sulfurtransferase FdhD, partial [Luteibacter jiangsuensis]